MIKHQKTHCPHGHPYKGDNIYYYKKTENILCRTCMNLRSKTDYYKNRDKFELLRKKYIASGKALEAIKRWEQKNPNKRKVHEKLNGAIRSGKIIKFPCEKCGNQKVDGHHPDYSKPLEVMWLCRKHHKEEHRRLKLLIKQL